MHLVLVWSGIRLPHSHGLIINIITVRITALDEVNEVNSDSDGNNESENIDSVSVDEVEEENIEIAESDFSEEVSESPSSDIDAIEIVDSSEDIVNNSEIIDIDSPENNEELITPIEQEDEVLVNIESSSESIVDDEVIETEQDSQNDNLTEEDLDFIDTVNPINTVNNSEDAIVSDEVENSDGNSMKILEDDMDDFSNLDQASEGLTDTDKSDIDYADSDEISDDIVDMDSEREEYPSVVPIYPVEDNSPIDTESQMFNAGDRVVHPKYGEGVVEKMVKLGSKVLCSINFANGRRLLDPTMSNIEQIN